MLLLAAACSPPGAPAPVPAQPADGACVLLAEPGGGRELDFESPGLRFTVPGYGVRGRYQHVEAVFLYGKEAVVARDVAVDVDVDDGDRWSGRVEAAPAAVSPAADWRCPAPRGISLPPAPPSGLPGVFPPASPGTPPSPR